jgi:hypothetical protein
MSDQQWREWVSPDIDYIKACPDLPVAPISFELSRSGRRDRPSGQ